MISKLASITGVGKIFLYTGEMPNISSKVRLITNTGVQSLNIPRYILLTIVICISPNDLQFSACTAPQWSLLVKVLELDIMQLKRRSPGYAICCKASSAFWRCLPCSSWGAPAKPPVPPAVLQGTYICTAVSRGGALRQEGSGGVLRQELGLRSWVSISVFF